jgi:hypothetical protein
MKTLALACLLTLFATSASFAQSLTNFGPNAPAYGDSYGKPVAGTYAPLQKRGYRSYAYLPYWHHRHHHHYRHHRLRYWW